ncbi:MAG: winged helix-turn-helix domain-containing protein [Anaerolineales bacterium]|nr:winged helix-turn-helix domain-containing protein [Anaerolineales bacterium]
MTIWESYPQDYRRQEADRLRRAVCAGDCAALIGLSGSGKSNLLGYLAHAGSLACAGGVETPLALVDCNRLGQPTPSAFYRLVCRALQKLAPAEQAAAPALGPDEDEFTALAELLNQIMASQSRLALLLDRFDALISLEAFPSLASNLRALRDDYKYRLSYVISSRQLTDPRTELAELFFAHTIWLGPLDQQDAQWSARRDLSRLMAGEGDEAVLDKLIALTWGYPSMLRAACEAYASGTALQVEALHQHPAVARRIQEFWADEPDEEALQLSRLQDHPLLCAGRQGAESPPGRGGEAQPVEMLADNARLTAKEHLLLRYLQSRPNQVCEKDDLIQAVWPEEVIFSVGIRDESLAQLVRRLRTKIEADPSAPRYIHTIPGRGYLYRPE